jgi:hypothetical protein
MYLKFNDSKERYDVVLNSFTTQNGNKGVRIIGDVPENTSGFVILDDNDKVIGDFSAFTHLYNPNEYTETEEQKVPSHSAYTQPAPSVIDSLANSINAVNQRVSEITPYTESKTAYIDDTEILFESDKQGNIVVTAIDSDGESVNVAYKRDGNKILVYFEPLESITKVTISIQ